ncbi:MAG: hypothetical protein QOH61_2068, partial [Chloroflexota bacterium]|nr:hypothetical protein [Chloroflexota bacterium]
VYQRIPAPSARTMDSIAATAGSRRLTFAFILEITSTIEPRHPSGNRAVSERSLALRPRLATGLP